jgi:hypothetical protein
LLLLKNSLTNFETGVKEFQSAVSDILKCDEDLANMYLTYKSHTRSNPAVADHFQSEILLESYAKRAEDLLNEINQ